MNNLDKDVLQKHFPKVTPGDNRRYQRDDILKVLTFMKDHPYIQIKAIEEFSNISLGTLVSWRKKFGKYLDIKTKNYSDSGSIKDFEPASTEVKVNAERKFDLKTISQIPLSLIQELKKMHDNGSTAEITINEIVFRVDDQQLYVLEKYAVQLSRIEHSAFDMSGGWCCHRFPIDVEFYLG